MSYYVFSLPPDLLESFTLRTLGGQQPPSPRPASPAFTSRAPVFNTGSKTCNICLGVSFLDVDDQRAHFRSDWHRYNVKLRLAGANAVTESEFGTLVEALEDSLSGSASSFEEESNSSSPDAVRTLLAKSFQPNRSTSPASDKPMAPRTPLTWFHSPPSTQIGIYSALFPTHVPQESYISALKDMQHGGRQGRKWTMFMVAGGHFAGLVVRVHRPDDEEEGETQIGSRKKRKPKPELEVLRHKTFHRYTTRRKQGGSQSVNDNAKGPAKSAGALLRRYGEQALRDDIRNLLADWAQDIASSELIWIRASVSNKRIFYDYDESVFSKGDQRIRSYPFPTRRPTQSELTRCLNELTHVKTSHLTEEALRAQDEAYLASFPKPKPVPKPASTPKPTPKSIVPQLSKEEEALREKWNRLIEMVTKGRIEPFKGLWDREGAVLGGINVQVPERGATLLQLSALSGQEEMTRILLEDLRADPTVAVAENEDAGAAAEDSDASDAPPPVSAISHRTAYDLAATRSVRNVFRRCAATHPEWWDWLGAARVPSALSTEMEREREERKRERRKGLKDKIRERQAKQNESATVLEAAPTPTPPTKATKEPSDGPTKLGGKSGNQDAIAGLSAEMRAKVERERRARAAEARLKALGGRG